jgi:hypothetical protein
MYNRNLLLSSLLLAPALYCQVDFDEKALLSLKADPLILKALFSDGAIIEEGDDAKLRPRYVGTQGAFEQFFTHALASGAFKRVVAVIHTPLPATPVCTMGEITPDLVAPTLLQDEKRLQTVRDRASIIRTLLQTKGTVLIAYPAVAKEQRTNAQLEIFQSLLNKYPDCLRDSPLGCLEIAKEMIGATYIFETQAGGWRTFSIRFTQAIAPTHPTHAAMWLGDVENGPAAERLAQVSAYLQACQGPDLFSFISK